ncbi:LacI family repressor for deo operon, udp, cdd, tsx, nupC, and nupG [Yokenella regensburgei]|uniref:LacI family repressor for deo operon, udp, cdd, tsx, nupC, and nupG n=1 Tax=Yokenella regensburgei TaxID=158877 RepID=A0ABX9S1D7_9ENTR|nr:substrate-binding domain-containing protein [Yokenella regensburgei]RKR63419.1 LacI family repressor for deo operon, udp, cdd, tsx, nupC, and nupG [Yokenella regensburgei]
MKGSTKTMKEIAIEACVSVATVSRALNHPEKVAVKTLQRIEKAITVIGYATHKVKRIINPEQPKIILVVIGSLSLHLIKETIDGIEINAAQHGFKVLINNVGQPQCSVEDIVNLTRATQVDGLLLLGLTIPCKIDEVDELKLIPMVMANEFSLSCRVPSLHVDSLAVAFEVVEYFFHLGHTQIACILGEDQGQTTRNLLHGYTRALQRYQLECDHRFVINSDLTYEAGKNAFSTLMDLPERPTAIFCQSDTAALGVVREAKKMGISVPTDISVIGFGNTALAKFSSPALSTVNLPNTLIGQTMVQLLVNKIEGDPGSAYSKIFAHEVIMRESTAPLAEMKRVETVEPEFRAATV